MVAFLDEDTERKIEIAWCPSHCGIGGNERADRLAKQATELAFSAPIWKSRAHMRRRAKEIMQEDWQQEWSRYPLQGHFAISNRIPPTIKPTKHFRDLRFNRELFGRLMQCRTGHGYIGEYYQQFHINESIDCPCGEELQTREHILRECPRYEESREELRKVSRDIVLSDILGTMQGIKALTKFLGKSGAFSRSGEGRTPREAPVFEDEPEPPDEEEPHFYDSDRDVEDGG